MMDSNQIYLQDCLSGLDGVCDSSVTTVHTSPPYNIGKKYSGYDDSLAKSEYVDFTQSVIRSLFRVLKPGGSVFWQTGYTSFEDGWIYPLDHLAFELFLDAGFRLKDRIIWRYFGGMSFKAKFTNKHETILWWIKPGATPKFDVFPVRERSKELDPRNNLYGRNPGNVWEVDRVAFGSIQQTSHIAVFPEEISDRIVLSTSDEGDICLDPFSGSGTLCKVAKSRGRRFIGFEIAECYHKESIIRLGLTANSVFRNILSGLMKHLAFQSKSTEDIRRILDFVYLLLNSAAPMDTGIFRDESECTAILNAENSFSKPRKVELWKASELFLNNEKIQDSIHTIDRCFSSSYKLNSAYSGVMRMHSILKVLDTFRKMEHQLYSELQAVVNDEWETYSQKGNRVTLKNRTGKILSQKRKLTSDESQLSMLEINK